MNSAIVSNIIADYQNANLFNENGFVGYREQLKFWSDVKSKINAQMEHTIVMPDWVVSFTCQRQKQRFKQFEQEAKDENRSEFYPITAHCAANKLRVLSLSNYANVPILFLIDQRSDGRQQHHRVAVGMIERQWEDSQCKYNFSYYEPDPNGKTSPPILFRILYNILSKSITPRVYTGLQITDSNDKFLNAIAFIAYTADGNDYRSQLNCALVDRRNLSSPIFR